VLDDPARADLEPMDVPYIGLSAARLHWRVAWSASEDLVLAAHR
jgi:hypothetical protein